MGEQPVGEQPVEEEPVGEQPVEEEPVGEEPVGEEPVGEEPVGEEPVGFLIPSLAKVRPLPFLDGSSSQPLVYRSCRAKYSALDHSTQFSLYSFAHLRNQIVSGCRQRES